MTSWIAAVLNSLWQAFAIAALVWLVLKFGPRVNAATRHAVWWVVLALVILLPAASILIEKERIARGPASTSAVIGTIDDGAPAAPVAHAAAAPPRSASSARIQVRAGVWSTFLPVVWLAALLVQLARIAWSYRRVQTLKRN